MQVASLTYAFVSVQANVTGVQSKLIDLSAIYKDVEGEICAEHGSLLRDFKLQTECLSRDSLNISSRRLLVVLDFHVRVLLQDPVFGDDADSDARQYRGDSHICTVLTLFALLCRDVGGMRLRSREYVYPLQFQVRYSHQFTLGFLDAGKQLGPLLPGPCSSTTTDIQHSHR